MCDLLGEDEDGYWAATSGGVICPRQNGKGSIIEALELAWLFLFDVELIFHSAHLFSTAQDAFRRIKSLIRDTPDLDRQVLRYSEAHGQEGIELRSGQRLRFVARSKSGGRGFPAPVVVLDEAFNLGSQAVAALVPTMAAQSNPFLLFTSSHPIDDPCSDVLRGFMRRSRSGEVERRCYIEYAADPAAKPAQQLRQANPGYRLRLNDDVIAEERELLTPQAYLIERLGIVDLSEEAERWLVVGHGPWRDCARADHKPDGGLRYALDVDENSRGELRASVAVSDGVHVELVTPPDAPAGTAWVVPMCERRKDDLKDGVWLDPSGPAAALVEPMVRAGVEVHTLKGPDLVQAAMGMLAAVNDLEVRHIDQAALNVAAAGVVQRKMSEGAWRWSRTLSSVDIGPMWAVSIARWAAMIDTSEPGGWMVGI